MTILILVIIVLVLTALLIWGVDQIPQVAPMGGLIKALIIVLAVVFIAQRSGLF
jgi:preprotein translocase subunit SecE